MRMKLFHKKFYSDFSLLHKIIKISFYIAREQNDKQMANHTTLLAAWK